MNQADKKYFGDPQSGRLNADDSPFAITTNEWINAENVRTGSSDRGFTGIVESVGGNSLIPSQSPIVSDNDIITIGSVEDIENNRIVYFNYDNNQNRRLDQIICVYPELNGGTQYLILNSTQVTKRLNFSKNSLIHSAKIAGNILSFPDGKNNEPRKINIERGIKANYPTSVLPFGNIEPYVFPLEFSEITLIKRPPIFTPNISKSTDALFLDNLISNYGFEFAFQYQYYDGEVTVPSSYSLNSRLNDPNSNDNLITVQMSFQEKIPSTVRIVNLIVREGNGRPDGSTYAHITNTWDKNNSLQLSQINDHNNQTNQLTYFFYNNFSGETIASDDTLRAFDNVPIYSQAHEVSKGRYFLGNNTEGYATPAYTSLYANVDSINNINQTTININATGLKWGDYSRFSWSVSAVVVYINFGNYQQGYYTVTNTEAGGTGNANNNPPSSFNQPLASGDLTFCGNSYDMVKIHLWVKFIAPVLNLPYNYNGNINPYTGNATDNVPYGYQSFVDPSTNYYNVMPQLSRYKLGVVFYDYAMRKCGVCVNTNATSSVTNVPLTNASFSNPPYGFYIPFDPNNPFFNLKRNEKITIINTSTGFNYGTFTVYNAYISGSLYYINIVESSFNGLIPNGTNVTIISKDEVVEVNTVARDFDYTSANNNINWYLGATGNFTAEIPEWAYYYSVVKTLNLRTRFFVQSISVDPNYVIKDGQGKDQPSKTFSSSVLSIKLDLTALSGNGLGYTYSEGDQCIITLSTPINGKTTIDLPVLSAADGNVYVKPYDLQNLTGVRLVYELYTPYKEQIREPYYEMGNIYPIVNPGTSNRVYFQTQGTLRPDSWAFKRAWTTYTYFSCAMSPNDTFYKKWETDAGKVDVVTPLGSTEKSTNIAWSDTYILGTQVTGSSTFRFGNDTYVPDECGGITKLQLTSKVKDSGQGNVMLGLCSAETVSMYLGETQITDSTGKTQFFGANASQVISTINTLKGNYGCLNPESVSQYRGHVYFLDVSNGRVVQYSDNGLDSISLYKMSIFWKNWCKEYLRLGTAAVGALGDRPYIFTVVDPNHDELLLSIPKLSNTPPTNFGTPPPFNILDYKGKTITFKLGTGAIVMPHWQSAFTFSTENFVTLQNKLYSFKLGKIWVHNQEQQNSFYGALPAGSKIMFTSNILPQIPKVYNNFVSESNYVPDFVYFYNNNPILQTSNLINDDFKNQEGVWYATILRDEQTPGVVNGLLQGDVMRNKNMYVLAEFNPVFVPPLQWTTPLELKLLQLGTSISRGHTI